MQISIMKNFSLCGGVGLYFSFQLQRKMPDTDSTPDSLSSSSGAGKRSTMIFLSGALDKCFSLWGGTGVFFISSSEMQGNLVLEFVVDESISVSCSGALESFTKTRKGVC